MSKIQARTLKGFRDFLPEQAKKRQYIINVLEEVFESYGFEPLETPALEYEEVLLGKYGAESDKLMYSFEDKGGRRVALRYDQTVPLARYIAQNYQNITFPFKRYQIQPVWRAENPQKGRFREFLQCDADIVGTLAVIADAEIISTAVKALQSLGFRNFKILINDRYVYSELGKLVRQRFPNSLKNQLNMFLSIPTALDKLEKFGREKVINELKNNGFSSEEAQYILEIVGKQKPTESLKKIFESLEKFGIKTNQYEFNSGLARGLDYYTGMIFEIEIEGYNSGSVCGGGRYDNLIGMFGYQKIPAVGFSFGFDRLYEAMEEQKLFPEDLDGSTTQILITVFPGYEEQSMKLTSMLRDEGINTELYLEEAKFDKQLKYADKKNIPYAVVIGPEEAKKKVVKVKDMKIGTQEELSAKELIDRFKNKNL